MTPFHRITELYTVSPQISADDMARVKAGGFAVVMCNRPDGEAPGQPPMAEIENAARAQGLAFKAIPIGPQGITATALEEAEALIDSGQRIFAYCRTGTRCTILHALVRAGRGEPLDVILADAAAAGYDLSPFRDRLEAAAP